MKQYAQRDIKNYLHYYTFPRWSAENKYLILILSLIAMLGGVFGAGLSYSNIPSAIFVWHFGIAVMAVLLVYCVKGKYQEYMDCGWDIYY
jgi:uncharacterized membrane protein YfcA